MPRVRRARRQRNEEMIENLAVNVEQNPRDLMLGDMIASG